MPSSRTTIAYFVALLASALVLGPALAHVLDLPNKIGLPRDECFIVQKADAGGAAFQLLGFCLLVSAVLSRGRR